MVLKGLPLAKAAAMGFIEAVKAFDKEPTTENEERLYAATANNLIEGHRTFDELKERHDNK